MEKIMNDPSAELDRILRLPEVKNITGKCRSGIYADIKIQQFPRQVPIGKRAVGWRKKDIKKWLDNRPTRPHKSN
jgi:prophage regulatory protein